MQQFTKSSESLQGLSKYQGNKVLNNQNIEENSRQEMEYPPAFRPQDKCPVNVISHGKT